MWYVIIYSGSVPFPTSTWEFLAPKKIPEKNQNVISSLERMDERLKLNGFTLPSMTVMVNQRCGPETSDGRIFNGVYTELDIEK